MIHDSAARAGSSRSCRNSASACSTPQKVVLISDHFVPGDTDEGARILELTRQWAKERKVAVSMTAKASATWCCRNAAT
jgi:3-isopropylmalate/(R)-2-methylmalate dehydratase large subunit